MALFLESVESTVSAKYSNLSFNEMLCEGMLIGDEMLALNEAIYKADFIIHQRSQNLSESAQLLQESGFLGTVWEKVKSMVSKVWEWIKATWTKFTAKLSEWANRIMDRLSGDGKEIRKSAIKLADLLETLMGKMIDKVVGAADKISAASDNNVIKDTEVELFDLKTEYDEAKKDAEKIEGKQFVSKTFAKKVADTAKRIEKSVRTAITKLEKLQATITKEVTALKQDGGGASAARVTSDSSTASVAQFALGTDHDTKGNKGDQNDIATANAKIGFIQKVTGILKNASSGAINSASSIMGALAPAAGTAAGLGGKKGDVAYDES